jgi:hippurate hydrolase
MVMIEEGVLDPMEGRPAVDCAFGQHVRPDLPTGVIGVRPGAFMAGSDQVTITVHGEGGHAAEPHRLACDPVYAAAQVITALQSVISRNRPPQTPSVLSFGRIDAGNAPNVIPDDVTLFGTFRTMDEAWRRRGYELIERVARHTVEAFGGTAEVAFTIGYPALVNDDAETSTVRDAACRFVGPERVVDVGPWYVAEDFARYLQRVPGCFYVLGTGNTKTESTFGLHTPRFTIDEEALRTGSAFLAYLAWRRLKPAA